MNPEVLERDPEVRIMRPLERVLGQEGFSVKKEMPAEDTHVEEATILEQIHAIPQFETETPTQFIRWFIEGSVALCNTPGGLRVYKKPREDGEYHIAKAVDSFVSLGLNEKFKILRLPKYHEIQKQKGYLLMEYLGDNSAVIEKWQADGANGGVNMTLELSREMAELIDDFSYIPTDDIIPGQERFTYDPEKALAHFLQKLEGVQKNGYLTTTEMERGREIVGTMNQPLPNLVFNNGDFYPRNLIPKNGVE